MRSGNSAKFLGASQTDKAAEVLQVILVRTTRAWVVDIGEPLHCRRHRSQVLKLRSRQPTLRLDNKLGHLSYLPVFCVDHPATMDYFLDARMAR
ncbi:hypothetical protein ALO97_200148 [Pseudomonas syringae pv. tagetis]|nr:hypothetical protein ALO97_200148 [Pseudomonas syringae pv. tagetis]